MNRSPPVVAGAISLTGDFQRLDDIAAAWSWQARNYQAQLAVRLSRRTVELAQDCFKQQRDPNGDQWRPSKMALGQQTRFGIATHPRGYGGLDSSGNRQRPFRARNAFGLTLIETGDLFRDIHVASVTPSGFVVNAPQVYAAIHQYGGPIGGFLAGKGVQMPRRSYFPVLGRLGPIWSPAWQEAAKQVWLDGFTLHGFVQ